MVAGSIEQRIKKMKEAILTEAKQRAHMIVENANEEADQERAKIYNTEKQKIQLEFAQLAKAQKIKEKMYFKSYLSDKSALTNKHRIRRMTARYQFVEKLKGEVSDRLRKVLGQQDVHQKLLQQLIVQGMLRLMERNVTIQLRANHLPLAKSLFPACEQAFSRIILDQTGREMESKLTVSEYKLEEQNLTIIGGVYLRTSDGVIVCDNTLDSRVRLLFQQLLPTIRNTLFPKRVEKPQEKSSQIQEKSPEKSLI